MKRHLPLYGCSSPKYMMLAFDHSARSAEIEREKEIEALADRIWTRAIQAARAAGFEDSLELQAQDKIRLRKELLGGAEHSSGERISILPPGARLSVQSLRLSRNPSGASNGA